MHLVDQTRDFARRHGIVAHVGRDDFSGQFYEIPIDRAVTHGWPLIARLPAGESHSIPSIATSEYRDQAYILKLLSNFRIRKKKIAVLSDNYWSNTTTTRRNKIISANNGHTLRFLCKVAAQFVDRCKAQCSLRQLGFDRTVDIKRIAHSVDDA